MSPTNVNLSLFSLCRVALKESYFYIAVVAVRPLITLSNLFCWASVSWVTRFKNSLALICRLETEYTYYGGKCQVSANLCPVVLHQCDVFAEPY